MLNVCSQTNLFLPLNLTRQLRKLKVNIAQVWIPWWPPWHTLTYISMFYDECVALCMHLEIRIGSWYNSVQFLSILTFFKHGYKFDFPRSCMNAREDVPWAGFSFSCWPRAGVGKYVWKYDDIRWWQVVILFFVFSDASAGHLLPKIGAVCFRQEDLPPSCPSLCGSALTQWVEIYFDRAIACFPAHTFSPDI